MNRLVAIPVAAAVLLALGGAGGYYFAHRAMAAPASQADGGRAVLYWHDPMYPQHKFDKPGKSPFMDMDLVPVYADEAGAAKGAAQPGVAIDPAMVQRLGVRTAVAEKGRLATVAEAVGTVAFDERAVAMVQPRTNGYVEAVMVRAPLDPVRRGEPLVRLFVPEWAGAQQEYLAMRGRAPELARAARERLLLLGMSEAQVATVEREGRTVAHVTLAAPLDGVVGELAVREGMTVAPGMTLYRINGLGNVWINLEIPESQAGAIRPGAQVTAQVPAYPGERFAGRIAAVLPQVDAATRTLRARVEVPNPGGRLKPGMFATVTLAPASGAEAVLVPSEAVIVTGERSVVIVDRGDGRFEQVQVKVGREGGGRSEILAGLDAGMRVVSSGQFLLDSEASLRGTGQRVAPLAAPGAKPASAPAIAAPAAPAHENSSHAMGSKP